LDPRWGTKPRVRRTAGESEVKRDVEGLSNDEACAVFGISVCNQRVLPHRGRSQLREALDAKMAKG